MLALVVLSCYGGTCLCDERKIFNLDRRALEYPFELEYGCLVPTLQEEAVDLRHLQSTETRCFSQAAPSTAVPKAVH